MRDRATHLSLVEEVERPKVIRTFRDRPIPDDADDYACDDMGLAARAREFTGCAGDCWQQRRKCQTPDLCWSEVMDTPSPASQPRRRVRLALFLITAGIALGAVAYALHLS